MEKQPGDRYQSPAELLTALGTWRSKALEPTVIRPAEEQAVPTLRDQAAVPTDDAQSAAPPDADTLVRPPTTGVPTFLIYLIPVLAAVILAGVYFGVQALRRGISEADPLVVEVPARPARDEGKPSPKPADAGRQAPLPKRLPRKELRHDHVIKGLCAPASAGAHNALVALSGCAHSPRSRSTFFLSRPHRPTRPLAPRRLPGGSQTLRL